MQYKTMVPGVFLARPNRFIAHIEIDGKPEVCHVKNTGRCKELLPPGAIGPACGSIPGQGGGKIGPVHAPVRQGTQHPL